LVNRGFVLVGGATARRVECALIFNCAATKSQADLADLDKSLADARAYVQVRVSVVAIVCMCCEMIHRSLRALTALLLLLLCVVASLLHAVRAK
jgi:hypothetical protein